MMPQRRVHAMRVAALIAAAVSRQPCVDAQGERPASPQPVFDSASVARNSSGTNGTFLTYRAGRFKATSVTVRMLIRSSYGLQDAQIVGGPQWITADRYDIVATGDVGDSPALPVVHAGAPSRLQLMVRALLADRFKLIVHGEQRQAASALLVLASDDRRLGPGLRRSEVDCVQRAAATRRATSVPPTQTRPDECGDSRGLGSLSLRGRPIAQLANSLSNVVGRPVIDRTGLAGNYDVDLTWASEQNMFTAVGEQLGLRLVMQTNTIEVLVVDRVERPVED